MNPERWQKVKAILEISLEKPKDKREAFIVEACGADDELKTEVESLLAYQTVENVMFEEGNFALDNFLPDAKPMLVGRQIGKYRILEEIGAGGMGAVFLAERTDGEFAQQVAVKFLRQAFSTAAAKRKFLQERQILARLKHPFIAQLIDGGTTEDGTPYLVMEYVAGKPITRYAEDAELGLDEKLELFRNVCRAVQFAHQNFIVHRDLKPDNILITQDGTPKLLDFGIAKLISETEIPATLTRFQPFTPDYAAPEQITGQPISAASDVYSLGVILYELLTGVKPYQKTSNISAREIAARFDNEPRRPSSVFSSGFQSLDSRSKTQSATEPNTRGAHQKPKINSADRKLLRGDLDTIVVKSLKRNAAERYASVEKFADDIRRFQTGLPISARPDTFFYRASKFVKRNRFTTGAAILSLAVLSVGIGTALYQKRIAEAQRLTAERRAAELQKLSYSFVAEIHDEVAKLPGSLEVRRKILLRGVEQLDQLARESGDNPKLLKELAEGYSNLGEMPDLSLAEIEENRHKAAAIYERLIEKEPTNSEYKMHLAQVWLRLADSQKIGGNLSNALNHARRASASIEALAAAQPDNLDYQYALWNAYQETGGLLLFTGETSAALEAAQKALALGEKIYAVKSEDNYLLTHSRNLLANALTELGEYDIALGHLRLIYDEFTKNHLANPTNVIHRYEMWAVNFRIGKTLAQKGDTADALKNLADALPFIEKLAADSPLDKGYQRNHSYTLYTTAQILLDRGEPLKATPYLNRALKISEAINKEDSQKAETIADLAIIHGNLGEMFRMTNQREKSLEHHRESLILFEKLKPEETSNAVLKRNYRRQLERMRESGAV